MKCMCGRNIEQERFQLTLNVCKVCAHQGIGQIQRKGIMVYVHKTAGECQIVSEDNFNDYRRLNPYSRHSGRGSGVHVVSPKAK